MTSKSAAIVGFIANLIPLYVGERIGDDYCARSLTDGTLILPVSEAATGNAPDHKEGWVRVHWQGDPGRETETLGSHMASLALVRYIEMQSLGQPAKRVASEFAFMASHFSFKTGCSLDIEPADVSPDLIALLKATVGRWGERAVFAALMKAIGM